MGIKISALPSAGSISNTDVFPVSQGSTTRKVAWSTMLSAFLSASSASAISSGNYTALPASVSTINFSNTTGVTVGAPIRITQSSQGIAKFYIVTSVTTNTQISVAGPPLVIGDSISEIAIVPQSRAVQVEIFIPGAYDLEDDTTALILRGTRSSLRWQMPKARLVRASFAHRVPGTGTQPNVNVSIAGTSVFTDNTNAGALLSGSANTWVSVGAGTAALANYVVNFGDAIELVLNAGANLDARDLSASLTFVLE